MLDRLVCFQQLAEHRGVASTGPLLVPNTGATVHHKSLSFPRVVEQGLNDGFKIISGGTGNSGVLFERLNDRGKITYGWANDCRFSESDGFDGI